MAKITAPPPPPSAERSICAGDIRDLHPDNPYVAYHAPRYAMLLSNLRRSHRPGGAVLDVGRSPLTEMIAGELDARVDTLGLQPDSVTSTGQHFRFELNDTQSEETWRRGLPKYDTIVFAEVLEHIHTAPTLVLAFLETLLEPDGIIVLQTPNAVALHKRIQMLCGKNPYELFREDLSMPGHYREYTRSELLGFATDCGFDTIHFTFGNYFDYRYRGHGHGTQVRPRPTTINWIYRLLPGFLKPGITMVMRRHGASTRPVPSSELSTLHAPAAKACTGSTIGK